MTVPDISAFGSLSTSGSVLQLALAGARSVGFTLPVGNTLVGTLVAEVSHDGGVTWQQTIISSPTPAVAKRFSQLAVSSSSGGYAILVPGGAGMVRLRVSAYTSGTVTVNMRGSFVHDAAVGWSTTPGTVVPPEVAFVGGTDGTNVRGLAVDSAGRLKTNIDGDKYTYCLITNQISMPTSPTDLVTLYGSATMTVRILRVTIDATQTTAGTYQWYLFKRTSVPTGGSSSPVTITSYDTNNPTTTVTNALYWQTTAPSQGGGAAIRTARQYVGTTAGTGAVDRLVWDFGRAGQAVVLRGTSQGIAVNCGTVQMAGAGVNVFIEWTEE